MYTSQLHIMRTDIWCNQNILTYFEIYVINSCGCCIPEPVPCFFLLIGQSSYIQCYQNMLTFMSNGEYVYMRMLHTSGQAPVPLSIFRSNSKFDENSKHSSVKYTWPITTIFCTRHDSVTVVTCAKYRCDRSSIFETIAFWIFIEFRIRSKYA